jgi:hypothetical protein
MNPQDQPDNTQLPSDTNAPGQPPSPAQIGDNATGQTAGGFTEVALPTDAEDTDLIEKEWVERAKQIVEHTREDPYEQQRALSQMKADYLKKRYNKDIKVSDD